MSKVKEELIFLYRGSIERWSPSRRNYVWYDGFSTEPETQPWSTRRECHAEARRRGRKAIFRYEKERAR